MLRHHRAGMQAMCEASRKDIMKMMSWYVARESDGAFLGFKPHPSGQAKILAVAHVDYLASGKVYKNNRKRIVSSALDDRAGVYIALHMLEEYGVIADVVLTDAEEIGRSTLPMFGAEMLKKYNWVVQLDRGGTDAVTYGYTEFSPELEQFWRVSRGGKSDIAYIEDICPVSAFNLGVAYYQAHREDCFLIYRQLHSQLRKFKEFYDLYVDERMDRKHFDGEMWDVPRPPKVVWKAPVYNRAQVAGFFPLPKPLDECTWCKGKLGAKPKMTDWGSELCDNCWDDWVNDFSVAKDEDEKLTWCADCGHGTYYPKEVAGKGYCVDCFPLAELMHDPFGHSD